MTKPSRSLYFYKKTITKRNCEECGKPFPDRVRERYSGNNTCAQCLYRENPEMYKRYKKWIKKNPDKRRVIALKSYHKRKHFQAILHPRQRNLNPLHQIECWLEYQAELIRDRMRVQEKSVRTSPAPEP